MAKQRERRQPQRTCIGCHRASSKRQLVRIVRTTSGEIAIDPTGKLAGRGAYLCANRPCWVAALKHKGIGRALKITVTDEANARLQEYAEQLPDVGAEPD